jgi:hypothetical protein
MVSVVAVHTLDAVLGGISRARMIFLELSSSRKVVTKQCWISQQLRAIE